MYPVLPPQIERKPSWEEGRGKSVFLQPLKWLPLGSTRAVDQISHVHLPQKMDHFPHRATELPEKEKSMALRVSFEWWRCSRSSKAEQRASTKGSYMWLDLLQDSNLLLGSCPVGTSTSLGSLGPPGARLVVQPYPDCFAGESSLDLWRGILFSPCLLEELAKNINCQLLPGCWQVLSWGSADSTSPRSPSLPSWVACASSVLTPGVPGWIISIVLRKTGAQGVCHELGCAGFGLVYEAKRAEYVLHDLCNPVAVVLLCADHELDRARASAYLCTK